MICRMTGINCPYANEYGYCDSTACHNMDIVGNIIPKERPENISNSSIWVKHQSNWHTGTPTEEGEYLCVFKRDGRDDDIVYGWCTWDGKAWDIYLNAVDYVICTIVAWQKITPYEEKEK